MIIYKGIFYTLKDSSDYEFTEREGTLCMTERYRMYLQEYPKRRLPSVCDDYPNYFIDKYLEFPMIFYYFDEKTVKSYITDIDKYIQRLKETGDKKNIVSYYENLKNNLMPNSLRFIK